jgi:uncharacterized membrane protein (UPF0127 family)
MSKKTRIIILVISVIIFIAALVGIFMQKNVSVPMPTQKVSAVSSSPQFLTLPSGKKISVEVADTQQKQIQGLSDRTSLAQDSGMLFVFDKPDTWQMWMKDMHFSLDMLWLDQNMKVIYVKEHATPESYPEAYGPRIPATYVLEVKDGFVKENNITEGSQFKFTQ